MNDGKILSDLHDSYRQLSVESGQYKKYRDRLELETKNLITANEKLLESLKDRYTRVVELSNAITDLDDNISEQITIISQVSAKYDQITKFVEAEKPEAINSTIYQTKHELIDLRTQLIGTEDPESYEASLLNQIKQLSAKRDELKKKNTELNSEFSAKFGEYGKQKKNKRYLSSLLKIRQCYTTCTRLRRDKKNIIRYQNKSRINQKKKKVDAKPNLPNPYKSNEIFEMLEIGISSNTSISNLTSLCETESVQLSEPTESSEYERPEERRENRNQFLSTTEDQYSSHPPMNSTQSLKPTQPVDSSAIPTERKAQSVLLNPTTTDKAQNTESVSKKEKKNKDKDKEKKQKENKKEKSSHRKDKNKEIEIEKSSSIETKSSENAPQEEQKSSRKKAKSKKSTKVLDIQKETSDTKESKGSNNKDKSKKISKSEKNPKNNEKFAQSQKLNIKSLKIDIDQANKHKSHRHRNGNSARYDSASIMTDQQPEKSTTKSRHRHHEDKKSTKEETASQVEMDLISITKSPKAKSRKKNFIIDAKIDESLSIPYLSEPQSPLFLSDYEEEEVIEEDEEEEEIFEEDQILRVIDDTAQTKDLRSVITTILVNQELEHFKTEDQIHESINTAHDQLANIDMEILTTHHILENIEAKKRDIIRSLSLQSSMDELTLGIVEETETNDQETSTIPIAEIPLLREQILENSAQAPKQLLMTQQKNDLERILEQRRTELRVTEMSNERKGLDLKYLLNRLRIVDPFMYGEEVKQPPHVHVDDDILTKRDKKKMQQMKLIGRIKEALDNDVMLSNQIYDVQFVIKELQRKLLIMAKDPRSNVTYLCDQLKVHRAIINETTRQLSFATIEAEAVDKDIYRYNEMYSKATLGRMQDKNTNLYTHLTRLKTRFNNLRAVKGKRNVVLTSEDELFSLSTNIKGVIQELDVVRMRMNGVCSKIEKQIRSVKEQNIRLPEPFSFSEEEE